MSRESMPQPEKKKDDKQGVKSFKWVNGKIVEVPLGTVLKPDLEMPKMWAPSAEHAVPEHKPEPVDEHPTRIFSKEEMDKIRAEINKGVATKEDKPETIQ